MVVKSLEFKEGIDMCSLCVRKAGLGVGDSGLSGMYFCK